MTDEEKLSMLKAFVADEIAVDPTLTDEVLTAYLTRAAQYIVEWRYPLESTVTDDMRMTAIDKYEQVQIEVAEELIHKRGAQGEVSHDETGIKRTYENAGVSASLKRRVTPMGKVAGHVREEG